MRTLQNWLGSVRFRPAVVAHPRDEDDLCRLVRASPGPVRVGGALHSWSPIAATDGTFISLDNLQGLLEVDQERGLARVRAGTRLHQLNAALAAQGLALPALGSIAQQSLAGATSTGTHGSSLTWGALHTGIRALRLIDGRGEGIQLGVDHPDLPGARLALGALGVLTELTLRVVPAFRLVEELELLPLERAAADLEAIARSAEWVKLWWLPHTEHALIFRYHRVGPAPDAAEVGALARWADQVLVNQGAFEVVLRLGALVPALVPLLSRIVRSLAFQPRRRAGPSEQMFCISMPPRHFETESAIPLAAAGGALAALQEGIITRGLRVNFVQELRFAPPDDTWLSGAYGRETCHFGAYIAGAWRGDTGARDRYYGLVSEILAPHDPRPHWGKEHVTLWGLVSRYPRGADFLALARRYDPDGRFRTPALEALLWT